MRVFTKIRKKRSLYGKWQVVKETTIPGQPSKSQLLFEHYSREKANTYEALYKQGRIK